MEAWSPGPEVGKDLLAGKRKSCFSQVPWDITSLFQLPLPLFQPNSSLNYSSYPCRIWVLANFFGKWPQSNYFRLCRLQSLLHLLDSAIVG